MAGAAREIERFLADNRSGDLWVVMGFVSPLDLAWLSARTKARRVYLVLNDFHRGFKESESGHGEAI